MDVTVLEEHQHADGEILIVAADGSPTGGLASSAQELQGRAPMK
jgi:hypothetical protein